MVTCRTSNPLVVNMKENKGKVYAVGRHDRSLSTQKQLKGSETHAVSYKGGHSGKEL